MGHNGMLNIKPNMSKCSAYNASIVVLSFIYLCKIFFHCIPIRAPIAPFSTLSLSTKSHLREIQEIQVLFILIMVPFFKLFALKLIPINYTSNTNHCSMNSQITNTRLIPFELREDDDFELIELGIACNGGHYHMQKTKGITPR